MASSSQSEPIVGDLRTLIAVMDVVGLKGNEFRDFLKGLWDAWFEHPYFDEYYAMDEFGYAPGDALIDPMCMGVYKHPKGLRGDTSYTIAELTQVAQLSFKEKISGMLGQFVGVQPIEAWVPLARPIRYRWGMIANSPLKGMLPREVRTVISKARAWGSDRKPKWHFLNDVLMELGQEFTLDDIRAMKRKPSLQPAEYRGVTKGELFLKYRVTPRERSVLAGYFEDLMDFWRIATGQVKSIEAENYINRQLTFPGWEVPIRRPE